MDLHLIVLVSAKVLANTLLQALVLSAKLATRLSTKSYPYLKQHLSTGNEIQHAITHCLRFIG